MEDGGLNLMMERTSYGIGNKAFFVPNAPLFYSPSKIEPATVSCFLCGNN